MRKYGSYYFIGIKLKMYGPIVSTTPLRQCLPFSCTTLRGKHCRHPIAVMGVVNTFGHGLAVMLSIPRMTTSKTINKIGGKPHKSNPTWNSWYI